MKKKELKERIESLKGSIQLIGKNLERKEETIKSLTEKNNKLETSEWMQSAATGKYLEEYKKALSLIASIEKVIKRDILDISTTKEIIIQMIDNFIRGIK